MSLRSFLQQMEKQKEVMHIEEEVSPRFEISAMMNAFDGGPILFFDNIKGFKIKTVANICGTRKTLCTALNVKPEKLYQKMVESWRSPTQPKTVKNGPVKEVTEKPDLSKIPILTHFEKDAAPYITSAIVSVRSPDKKIENVSIHRLMVIDKNHLAIRLVPRQLYKLWNMAREVRKDLDVAIAFGLHPAVMLAATSPLSFGVNEYTVANTFLGNGLQLIKCDNIDAYAPADAEIVLEGKLSAKSEVIEGPLVDITGTYDIKRNQPVIEIVSMMHREDYLYQALLPSGAEHKLLMGLPHETMIWEAVAGTVPIVKAVNLSEGGCGWLHVIISIEKQKDGDAKNALMAAFGAHPSLKHAIVVDKDIDVYNIKEVEWAVATRFQANEDLIVIPNARGSTLDPSADQETGQTTKLGIDATKPLTKPQEKFVKAKIPTNSRIARIIDEIKKKTE